MNFPHEYSSKFLVWLPSLIDTSYMVTPFHNSCNSSIKGAYMSPYLHPSLIFFQGWWGQTWQNLFVTRHGGIFYMSSNIGQVECLRLKSPNGFIPLVAKTNKFPWVLAEIWPHNINLFPCLGINCGSNHVPIIQWVFGMPLHKLGCALALIHFNFQSKNKREMAKPLTRNYH